MKRVAYPLLAVVAAGAVAVLLGLELSLRVADVSYPWWHRPDPALGWSLRPELSGWFTEEGTSFVQTNAAGQRDREHALDKPDNVYRIAVLGDAFSEGMHVALEQTYWASLPERLETCGFQRGKRIEILNFGVRGYGTAQAYLMLQTTAVRYRPDLVLLQFTNGSDVRDNSPALDPKRQERPFFVLDAHGELRVDSSFASSPGFVRRLSFAHQALRELTDRSRTLQLVRRARDLELMGRAHAGSTGNEAGLEIDVLAAPRDALWKEAWQITEGLIAKIGEFASRNGAQLAVFTVPFAMQVHPNAAQRKALQAKYGVPDLAYPDRRVAAFARQNGMVAITLADEMQAHARASGSYLYGFENAELGFGHWNALGHRAAAVIIARQLCALSF